MLRLIALSCFAAALLDAQKPPVSMRIATETGRAEFHQGERIPLVLTFETMEPGNWMVLLNGHDRSDLGLADDRFVTSPAEGTSDPWPPPRAGGIAGVPGQSFGGPATTFHVDLNQWVRFDRPATIASTRSSTRCRFPDPMRYFNRNRARLWSRTISA